jgi:hypothetical protein
MITMAAEQIPPSLRESADLVHLNVEKGREVADWLDALRVPVRASIRGALSADLSDLYVAAIQYQRLLDALLGSRPEDAEQAAELLTEIASELRHVGWHVRSAADRLDRLADRLDADDDDDRPGAAGGATGPDAG